MNPDRWQRLKEIFEEAVEMDSSMRNDFLESACGNDASLKSEVNALLIRHEADSFLEEPAADVYPELLNSEPGNLAPGKELGPYTIKGKIASGGMGTVYLAHDNRLDRQVAIKMLAGNLLKDPKLKERLRREARAAARLSHPGIATVYSLEESGDDMYIVSEYVSGRTLRQIMAIGPLPSEMVIDIAIQSAHALSLAHEYGIIHRDLKPENIMLTDNGSIKILDFGLARIETENPEKSADKLTKTGTFLGTPAYSSPEQLLGNKTDSRSDIFSFGVLLYELIAGRHPFGLGESIGTIVRIIEGDIPSLPATDSSYPNELNEIVQRCLQKNPDERYPEGKALYEDLALLQSSGGNKHGQLSNLIRKGTTSRSKTLWWWQFHQACAGFGYYGMIYPQWWLKEKIGGIEGSLLFFPLLIAVGLAANLRLHLWFTSKFYPSELENQRKKDSPWIRIGDWLFVIILAITVVRIHTEHSNIATLLTGVAIGALVAFTLIEPTTSRAALDRKE